MGETMKALIYEGPRMMNVRHVEIPVPGEREVLLRVERAGICGSELSGYLGHNSLRKPPLIMGHEFSGTIAGMGNRAGKFRMGERVAVNPLQSCGSCGHCLSGDAQLCADRKLVGAHVPGALSEYVVVAESNVIPIPDSLTFEEAAFAEPFACAVHVCRLLGLTAEERLLIVGAGPIGLCTLQAAKALGLTHIVVMDLNADRLQIVRELGGIPVGDERELLAVRPESGFDAAVDAVGVQATRLRCVEKVGRGGRIVFTGLHEADSTLPIHTIIREEQKLLGAFAYSPEDFAAAVLGIMEGKFKLLPWTKLEPLEQGAACFERLIQGAGGTAKILFHM
jgi:2-desacetyl-2-hydroxyethyl bacteriochlorophyllide A dehydrogenase